MSRQLCRLPLLDAIPEGLAVEHRPAGSIFEVEVFLQKVRALFSAVREVILAPHDAEDA